MAASDSYVSAPEFDAFVRAQLPRLVRYAVVLTGDRELAQDLVQDVMVTAHRRWAQVSAAEKPDRYATAMVTNAYLSWRRRWTVRNVISTARVPDVADATADPDEPGNRAELWRRLAGLPRRQRAVLVLRYYEGLSDAEIAALLGCAPSTVRVHIHRGLRALRLEMSEPVPSVSTTAKESR